MSTGSQGREFELIGGSPILDLVNTLDWRFREDGSEELLHSYAELLRFTVQSKLLTNAQARRLAGAAGSDGVAVLAASKELREAAAEVFYAALDGKDPAPNQIKTLERHCKEAQKHQKLFWSGSRLEWGWPQAESTAEMPLWLLSLSALSLMTSGEMQRVRACGNPDCRWVFLDTSKNHTRRWCDMQVCGNRMKARRFKAQRRGEAQELFGLSSRLRGQ